MNENLTAVKSAIAMLGRTSTVDTTSRVVPTARVRAALDKLVESNAQSLIDEQVNLRALTEDLFNWTGTPKANKNLMRAMSTALATPGKYAQAVELIAYTAAAAPLLEPDRLTRLLGLITEIDTAYAPARYTLQLSAKLRQLFERYPEERREKLLGSLFVEAHQGRWWDITAGQEQAGQAAVAAAPAEQMSNKDLLDRFCEQKLAFTPALGAQFAALKPTDRIRETLDAYNRDLLHERYVEPDTAIFASYIPWLNPSERPESPIGSLLETILAIMEAIEYDLPEKPKTFSGLFPNIRLYGGTIFPFPAAILNTDGRQLLPGVNMEIVKNATALADNRTFMGNCTWSYKDRMEKGSYVLYRLHHGTEIYNGSVIARGDNTWGLGELNSRFNRGNVPANVRAAFMDFIGRLPPITADNAVLRAQQHNDKVKHFTQERYKFKL